ncbi:hypothetical protein AXF42_Ash014821 [Apostasia shenzhenica]|uniref:Uncharacterized protein n=1 Tax=Apostasia shenzhenica TaxID=1088818 RepID=A0A2H9ZWD7_9ASPA|nr:hypothetical protein AXF42_Ash014821 [Apostasia shenzhenica]
MTTRRKRSLIPQYFCSAHLSFDDDQEEEKPMAAIVVGASTTEQSSSCFPSGKQYHPDLEKSLVGPTVASADRLVRDLLYDLSQKRRSLSVLHLKSQVLTLTSQWAHRRFGGPQAVRIRNGRMGRSACGDGIDLARLPRRRSAPQRVSVRRRRVDLAILLEDRRLASSSAPRLPPRRSRSLRCHSVSHLRCRPTIGCRRLLLFPPRPPLFGRTTNCRIDANFRHGLRDEPSRYHPLLISPLLDPLPSPFTSNLPPYEPYQIASYHVKLSTFTSLNLCMDIE